MKKNIKIENRFFDAFMKTNKEFIFIPIPKTGTTSIHRIMSEIYGRKISFPHHSYRWISNRISQENLARVKVFSTVRNPWDRMYSIFSYYRRGRFALKSKNFRDFIMTSPIEYANWYQGEDCWEDFYNQSKWLFNASGQIKVDKIFKLENLNSLDLNNFFGVNSCEIFHENRSHKNQKKHYSFFYDDDMIEVVYKLCKDDINNFKYNFEYGGA